MRLDGVLAQSTHQRLYGGDRVHGHARAINAFRREGAVKSELCGFFQARIGAAHRAHVPGQRNISKRHALFGQWRMYFSSSAALA